MADSDHRDTDADLAILRCAADIAALHPRPGVSVLAGVRQSGAALFAEGRGSLFVGGLSRLLDVLTAAQECCHAVAPRRTAARAFMDDPGPVDPEPVWRPQAPPVASKPWQVAGFGCSVALALVVLLGFAGAIVAPRKAATEGAGSPADQPLPAAYSPPVVSTSAAPQTPSKEPAKPGAGISPKASPAAQPYSCTTLPDLPSHTTVSWEDKKKIGRAMDAWAASDAGPRAAALWRDVAPYSSSEGLKDPAPISETDRQGNRDLSQKILTDLDQLKAVAPIPDRAAQDAFCQAQHDFADAARLLGDQPSAYHYTSYAQRIDDARKYMGWAVVALGTICAVSGYLGPNSNSWLPSMPGVCSKQHPDAL